MSTPSLEEKVQILAERYHLSSTGVMALAIDHMWEKHTLPKVKIAKGDLVLTFLDKYAELQDLRARIDKDL